jgi:hypothetical protein
VVYGHLDNIKDVSSVKRGQTYVLAFLSYCPLHLQLRMSALL